MNVPSAVMSSRLEAPSPTRAILLIQNTVKYSTEGTGRYYPPFVKMNSKRRIKQVVFTSHI
jgi:hypothetical protein